jgi:phosphatidylglycerol---prolipoprotein diacylglyceryl transferase
MFWQEFFPQREIFNLGVLIIHWYGVIVVLAILLGVWYALRLAKNRPALAIAKIDSLFFYLLIFSLLGARVYHVLFFNWHYYANHFWEIFKIWHGGLAIQGAILASIITIYLWAKKNKINFWKITDWLAPALILGQVLGRWGNYFNQELFGQPTSSWWKIPIARINRVEGYTDFTFFHPTFFYESVLNLVLFLSLYQLTKKKLKLGTITLVYLAGYSLIRFILEFIRIDPAPIVWGLRLPQIVSVAVIILAIWLYKKLASKK